MAGLPANCYTLFYFFFTCLYESVKAVDAVFVCVAKCCLEIFQRLLSQHSDMDPPCDALIEKLVLIFCDNCVFLKLIIHPSGPSGSALSVKHNINHSREL